MNLVKDTSKCCGCNLCSVVCTHNAISMEPDRYGYLSPRIEQEKCVNCGLCEMKCPLQNNATVNSSVAAYAASYNNVESIKNSSSGGIFFALAEPFIEQGGVVCGTAVTEKFNVEVVAIESKDELYRLQGSKYVQSSMGVIYKTIKQYLSNGKKVLFCGTPCQVAAVKNYIGVNENLLLVDIVCHGTPNNQFFKDYIKTEEGKKEIEIKEFKFRDKKYGQDVKGSMLFSQNGIEKNKCVYNYESSYYSLFLKGITFRDSCYKCPYAQNERVGDITICDFWGIDEVQPTVYKTMKEIGADAISGVSVNTEIGAHYFEQIEKNLIVHKVKFSDIALNNPQLNHPFDECNQDLRQKVLALYANQGYPAVDSYYYSTFKKAIMVRKIAKHFPMKLKKILVEIRDSRK